MGNVHVISELTVDKINSEVRQYYEQFGIEFQKLSIPDQIALWEIWNIRNGVSVSVETL